MENGHLDFGGLCFLLYTFPAHKTHIKFIQCIIQIPKIYILRQVDRENVSQSEEKVEIREFFVSVKEAISTQFRRPIIQPRTTLQRVTHKHVKTTFFLGHFETSKQLLSNHTSHASLCAKHWLPRR